MTVDPLQVRGLGLPPSVVAQARRGMSGPSVESIGPWTGTLEASVEDDWERGNSRTNWYLRTTDQRLQLHFGFTPRQRAGAAVRIEGLAIAGQVAVSGIAAQAAEPAVPTPQQCTTIGPQNIAVLMLTTPSFPSLPPGYTPSSLQQAFFGNPSDTNSTASLNGFWNEMSYGKTSATGQVFGPFALARDYTCDETAQIQTAAIAAADATLDFSRFTHLALVFPVSSCASYGAQDSVGCWTVESPSKGALNASVGWFQRRHRRHTRYRRRQPVPGKGHRNRQQLGHGAGKLHPDGLGIQPLRRQPGRENESGSLSSTKR